MSDERGQSLVAVLICVVVVFVLLFVLCDGDDDGDDLGWVPPTELADDDGGRNQRNKNGSDDCARASAPCSDDDFSPSPSFDKSPVEDSFNIQVCVTPGSCTGGEEEA